MCAHKSATAEQRKSRRLHAPYCFVPVPIFPHMKRWNGKKNWLWERVLCMRLMRPGPTKKMRASGKRLRPNRAAVESCKRSLGELHKYHRACQAPFLIIVVMYAASMPCVCARLRVYVWVNLSVETTLVGRDPAQALAVPIHGRGSFIYQSVTEEPICMLVPVLHGSDRLSLCVCELYAWAVKMPHRPHSQSKKEEIKNRIRKKKKKWKRGAWDLHFSHFVWNVCTNKKCTVRQNNCKQPMTNSPQWSSP